MATQPQSDRNDNGQGQYRRIITDFGGAGSIQGTEDWPVDPAVADVKAVGLAGLFGFAAVAAVPQGAPLAYRLVGWVFLALVLVMSLVVVYLAPSDQTPIGWVRAMVRFQRRPKRLTQHADRKEERTQPITGLDRVLPISGALRRDDGAIVGMIEVEGRDMALAETDAWEAAGKGFEDLADALDGGFDVFSPARTIEPGRLAGGYIGRQFDDDVRNSETLAALVETYQRELPREFRQRGTSVRQFYVVVWVTEHEVRREDHGTLGKLADLPYVGGLIRRVGLARREASDTEIRTRQKSILSARKGTVENSIAAIEGCTASEVDGERFAAVLQEYWTGVRTPHDGKPVPNTTLPIVTVGEADREEPSETGGY